MRSCSPIGGYAKKKSSGVNSVTHGLPGMEDTGLGSAKAVSDVDQNTMIGQTGRDGRGVRRGDGRGSDEPS
jgi:hypothetical protein